MLLSWNKGYDDYADHRHWLPRFDQLREFAQQITLAGAEQLSDAALLDAMEQLEELMRYYCATEDMANLEPVMRKYNDLLQLCGQRGIRGVEVQYLQMLFLRVNGLLYRAHGQHRQGAEHYDRCLSAAKQCFGTLRSTTHLEEEQVFYIGWGCVECFKEAAEAHDMIMDAQGSIRILKDVLPILQWLDRFMIDYSGISDQASELYMAAGGVFYQYGDLATGDSCYRSAARLLNAQDAVHGSDFYRARAIWVNSVHGTMAFLTAGDPGVMLQCEQDAKEYLQDRPGAARRDKAIVDAARAMSQFQRSVAFQQNGRLQEAMEMAQDAVVHMKESLDALKDDYENRDGYYRSVLSKIASRIYNSYIGAMESLGVMQYNVDPAAAEQTLKAVLDELTDKTGFHMAGSGAALIQAETLQYLALIESDAGNGYEADFYGTQAADMALNMAEESGNVNAWVVSVISCSIVAEVALNMKNKPKALQYAEKGLHACDMLERANPQHPHLALRRELAKFKKKASRRFF